MSTSAWPNDGLPFDPALATNVNLTDVLTSENFMRDVTCYLTDTGNDYSGSLGVRVSALFVILAVSSAVTFFPVLATRSKRIRIPLYVYLFARYFGAGVIIATAFVQYANYPFPAKMAGPSAADIQ